MASVHKTPGNHPVDPTTPTVPAVGSPSTGASPPSPTAPPPSAATPGRGSELLGSPSTADDLSRSAQVFADPPNGAKAPPIEVGAVFAADSVVPESFREVRSRGIQTLGEIETALDYLSLLGPEFSQIVAVVRERRKGGLLAVEMGKEGKNISFAHPTFHLLIDRTAEAYGEKITIHRGATPDILLHEIVHCLPLSLLRKIFPIDLDFPEISLSLTFSTLQERMKEHSRLNETLSFWCQLEVFERESRLGVTPQFNSKWMRELARARSLFGIRGLRDTFPFTNEHYERNLDSQAVILALIAKVEGRLDLTRDEWDWINSTAKKDYPYQDVVEYAQKYFNRQAQRLAERGIAVSPLFFNLGAAVERAQNRNPAIAIDFLFEALNLLEKTAETPVALSRRTLPLLQEPSLPEERKRLFAAYTDLVRDVLKNPPPALARSELSALIGYARLTPREVSAKIARLIDPYLGPGFSDLRALLGLLLHEKGFASWGEEMVFHASEQDDLSDLIPTLKERMGDEIVGRIFHRTQHRAETAFADYTRSFASWGATDYPGSPHPELDAAIRDLLHFPVILTQPNWHMGGGRDDPPGIVWLEFGKSLQKGGVPANWALSYQQAQAHRRAGERRETYTRFLSAVRKTKDLPPHLESDVDRAWGEEKKFWRGGLEALEMVVQQAKLDPFLPVYALLGRTEIFRRFSDRDLTDVLAPLPPDVSRMARALCQLSREEGKGDLAQIRDLALKFIEQNQTANLRRLLEILFRQKDLFPPVSLTFFHPVFRKLFETDSIFLPFPPDFHDVTGAFAFAKPEHPPFEKGRAYLLWGIHLDSSGRREHLRNLFRSLREEVVAIAHSPKRSDYLPHLVGELDRLLVPMALYVHQAALDHGFIDVAGDVRHFLFREIPSLLPPDTLVSDSFSGGRLSRVVVEEKSRFFKNISVLEWALFMDEVRSRAFFETDPKQRRARLGEWIERIRAEIKRGGELVAFPVLESFADRLQADGTDPDQLREFHDLMILQAMVTREAKPVMRLLTRIHESSLPAPVRDELLHSLFAELLDPSAGFHGANLFLAHFVDLKWHTPFSRLDTFPKYPRTESLLIRRLSTIPEIVDPAEAKDLSLRLRLFSAFGSLFQNEADWHASLDDRALNERWEEIGRFGRREIGAGIYHRLDLPDPATLNGDMEHPEVENFLVRHAGKMKRALEGSDENAGRAALLLYERLLLVEKPKQDQRSRYLDYACANDLHSWLDGQQKLEPRKRSPLFSEALKVSLHHHPPFSRFILHWNLSREEKRWVFKTLCKDRVLSRSLRRQIAELEKGSSAEAESRFYESLIKIWEEVFQLHPPNSREVSGFFTRGLISRPDLLERNQGDRTFLGKDTIYLWEFDQKHKIPYAFAERDLHEQGWKPPSDDTDKLALFIRALGFFETYLRHFPMEFSHHKVFNGEESEPKFLWARVSSRLDDFFPFFEDDPSSETDRRHHSYQMQLLVFAGVLRHTGWGNYVDHFDENRKERQPKPPTDLPAWADGRQPPKGLTNWIFNHGPVPRDLLVAYQGDGGTVKPADVVGAAVEHTKGLLKKMIRFEVADAQAESLPEFVTSRSGLERDLLLWVWMSLDPSRKILLKQELENAPSDDERLKLVGQAANLLKLLQLASFHPSVPQKYQERFEIFQEMVPPRDPIDARMTWERAYPTEVRRGLTIDLKNPLKEGTIGGVYAAKFESREIVFKLIPRGKREDILDSLELIRKVRRILWAFDYEGEGYRTVDDLLAFYERTILEELDLSLEAEKARALDEVVGPLGFVTPKYLPEFSSASSVAMEKIDSRRLSELSPSGQEAVFGKIDTVMIPAMLLSGVFHYDLHQGNIGVQKDAIVLYDMGRVSILNDEEKGQLRQFYGILTAPASELPETEKISRLKTLLSTMGTVRDAEAFNKIDSLLAELFREKDPLKALETIYPRLSDYGFCLNDNFVRLLFVFISWEGTKKSLRAKRTAKGPPPAPVSTVVPSRVADPQAEVDAVRSVEVSPLRSAVTVIANNRGLEKTGRMALRLKDRFLAALCDPENVERVLKRRGYAWAADLLKQTRAKWNETDLLLLGLAALAGSEKEITRVVHLAPGARTGTLPGIAPPSLFVPVTIGAPALPGVPIPR